MSILSAWPVESEVKERKKPLASAGLAATGAALLTGQDPSRRTIADAPPGGLNGGGYDKDKPPPSECQTCRKELGEARMHWHSKCPLRLEAQKKRDGAKRGDRGDRDKRRARKSLRAPSPPPR